MTPFNETDHPRDDAGSFADKTQTPPELALERPYGEDQRRLASLGFTVSLDRDVIENYSVEPAIWEQSVSESELKFMDLPVQQRRAVTEAGRILDARRGRSDSDVRPAWHRVDAFEEHQGAVAVYIRSRPETWTDDSTTLRILIDRAGGVVDAREGVAATTGGTVWNEL
jgi:hypothetical protein